MKLYLVIPCYNEEEVLPETRARLTEKMKALIGAGRIDPDSRIVFVNDGSKDRTWELIAAYHEEDPLVSGICLSRNRGHQNALLCGLMTVKDLCDAAVSMDADLQDDIGVIDAMLDEYEKGIDVVYGARSSRETDSAFKRFTAEGFYKLMKSMGAEVVFNSADCRLMTRRALDGLSEFGEVNLFLRGMVPMVGYPSSTVYYERHERFAGESKYPLKKMLNFAFEGITSLSVKPIRLITGAGVLFLLGAFAALIVLIVRLCMGLAFSGWGFVALLLLLVGGVQTVAIGLVGEYVGKVYLETKHRPRYIVKEFLHDEK